MIECTDSGTIRITHIPMYRRSAQCAGISQDSPQKAVVERADQSTNKVKTVSQLECIYLRAGAPPDDSDDVMSLSAP